MTREEREDAIDIIQSILDKYEEDECLVTEITIGDEDIKAFKMAIKALKQESKKGHWEHGKELGREYQGKTLVDITYENWHCSNCHCVIEQSIKPKWNYCPNCGSRNEVEE